MKALLDVNACLRYLLCDIEKQAAEVAEHMLPLTTNYKGNYTDFNHRTTFVYKR